MTKSIKSIFKQRKTIEQVEEGTDLAPKFDEHGLIPAITTDYATGEVLMLGYMNRDALEKTITTKRAHYWSRSRQKLWMKGEVSGLYQHVKQLLIDDDQDAVWLRVEIDGGASCHVGYRSCFYRAIPCGENDKLPTLQFTETEKTFDAKAVYRGQPNPTKI